MRLLRMLVPRPLRRGLLRTALTMLSAAPGVAVGIATHSPEAAAIAGVRVRLRDGRIRSVES
jgi:hypothetical protein